ncbi:MAG: imidazole glycerol phosphate synthase subunit HisH [Deltaproteobacteria bacterium]|nr:imidazole glycerol phosphate synthase subunit HisH [Deltaproteobacteria bacterium]
MKPQRVSIIDYGMGNLRSLAKALERCGAEVSVIATPAEVAASDRLVVPGQGAFGQAMTRLREHDIADAIVRAIGAGRPFLGVCLGLQVLFEGSDEAPNVPGLGIIQGQVTLLPANAETRRPHMGWSAVEHDDPKEPGGPRALSANASGEPFYFVHSFAARTAPREYAIATAKSGVEFIAALAHNNVVATQFHPEKSQGAGRRLLSAWLESKTS